MVNLAEVNGITVIRTTGVVNKVLSTHPKLPPHVYPTYLMLWKSNDFIVRGLTPFCIFRDVAPTVLYNLEHNELQNPVTWK